MTTPTTRLAVLTALVLFGPTVSVCLARQERQQAQVTVTLTGTAVVRTVALPPPEGNAQASEPTVAVDPDNAAHIAASAMYPSPRGGGSRRLWLWRSTDQGLSWTGERVVADEFEGDPDTAADPVLGFAPDGSVILTSMAMGEPFGPRILAAPAALPGGIYLSRWRPRGPPLGRAMQVGSNGWDSASRVRIGVDKPWMAIDHAPRSPHRGSIYLTWAALSMVGTPDTLASKGFLTFSRDGGKTFVTPRLVADHGFALAPALGATGTVDVVYANMLRNEGAGNLLQAIRSTDGAESFGSPERITRLAGDTVLELPAVAAHPDGRVLACWTEGPRHEERRSWVRCSTRTAKGWQPPVAVAGRDLGGDLLGWPTLVATRRGWSLLVYRTRERETEVEVLRSSDGRRFSRLATLARAHRLGSDRFCARSIGPCPAEALRIGHYVSLSASGDRLVAAFILPRSRELEVGKSGGVFVSVIDDVGVATTGAR